MARTIPRECLHCGTEFMGRPNRMYCSARCKDQAKSIRRRVRLVSVQLDHASRQLELAKLHGSTGAIRVQAWRLRQLTAEIEELEKGGL